MLVPVDSDSSDCMLRPMNKTERVAYIADKLEELYPNPPVPLDHKDPYTLLVAVLLSAQCTDERVNQVTPHLFALADTPESMAKVPVEHIYEVIRPCGLAPAKSKNISNLSKILTEQYGGVVPASMEQLEALPGVGHKTASVVMAQAFDVPAFPVDTHIHRLAQRWKLTSGANVAQTEKDLKRLAGGVSDAQMETAIALAELPLQIKGFGVVKQGNHQRAMAEREQLLARLDHKPEPTLKAAE